MYTVYVLQDNKGNLYKGYTKNMQRRFAEHKRGKTITTRRMRNLRVVYTEKFEKISDALKREKYLKSATGRRFLKEKLAG